jgi:hypothetical protein
MELNMMEFDQMSTDELHRGARDASRMAVEMGINSLTIMFGEVMSWIPLARFKLMAGRPVRLGKDGIHSQAKMGWLWHPLNRWADSGFYKSKKSK